MPGTPTTRYAIPTLAGTTLARDIDTEVNAGLNAIDGKMVGYSQGTLASRPTSTVGTPGIAGRRYRATDTGQEFIDSGTSWVEIASPAAALAAALTAALGHWRTIATSRLQIEEGAPAGTRIERSDVSSQTVSGFHDMPLVLIPFRATDYAVGGLTTRLRVKFGLINNNATTGLTFTAGLYPVAGNTGGVSGTTVGATAGAVVSGSTAAIVDPAAASSTVAVSSDFAPPADGNYVLAVTTSGTMPTSRAVMASLALEVHHF